MIWNFWILNWVSFKLAHQMLNSNWMKKRNIYYSLFKYFTMILSIYSYDFNFINLIRVSIKCSFVFPCVFPSSHNYCQFTEHTRINKMNRIFMLTFINRWIERNYIQWIFTCKAHWARSLSFNYFCCFFCCFFSKNLFALNIYQVTVFQMCHLMRPLPLIKCSKLFVKM